MQAPPLYIVRSIDLRTLVQNDYTLNISPEEEKKYFIKQADSPYLRLIRQVTGVSSRYNPFIIFVNINYHKDIALVVSNLVKNGIRVRGRKFVIAERSASMVRQGVLSFIDAGIADIMLEKVTMGLSIGKTVLSKWYAYRGLLLSSAHCVEDYVPKFIVVPDMMTTVCSQHIRYLYDDKKTYINPEGKEFEWTQKNVASDIRDITINAFDGMGIMHRNIAAEIERRTQSTTPITTCIFRAPFIKGCLHAIDYEGFLEERGVEYIRDIWGRYHSIHDEMIILTESMYKGFKYFKLHGDSRDWDRYWDLFEKYGHCIAIARTNFTENEEPVYTRSNYQILQTLDLPYADFRRLADESVYWINKIVDGDELYTKCFLGIVDGKCKALNPYVAAIAKNDGMMREPTIRKYVLSLVEKYMNDMKCGKLYIKSCFKFAMPDMIAFLEHIGGLPVSGILGPDEFWTQAKYVKYDGEYLVTRNPHICKSENVVLRQNNDPGILKWCGHLHNVAMVNIKSLVAQRLNGMDFDGDIILINDHPLMLQGSDKNALITIDVEDKVTALAEDDTEIGRIALISRTTKNMIGEFSNYASVYLNRIPQKEEQKKRYDDYLSVISVTVGKSIDYAKTGVIYPMPRIISKYGRPLPHFMKYRSPYYARQKLACAPSNMNRLCWELERWERGIRWRKEGRFDWHLMYDDSIAYTDEQFEAVEKLFLEFCAEISRVQKYQALVRKYQAKDIREKYTRAEASMYIADWDSLYRKYRERAKGICPDDRVLANIAVILTYVRYKSRGKKFPWVVAPDGLIKNIRPKDLMYIPEQCDDGAFTYLGKPYRLIPKLGDNIDLDLEPDIFDDME